MWIRNILGFAPGTQVPVGVTNDDLGIWSDSGHRGVVSADGSKIEFLVDHFSDYDLNYPTAQNETQQTNDQPPTPEPANNTANPAPSDTCPSCSINSSRVDPRSGLVAYDYEFPPIFRRGSNIAKKLTYSSGSVVPLVTLAGKTRATPNATLPTSVKTRFSFMGSEYVKDYEGETGIKETSFFTILSTVQPDGTKIKTGVYPYTVEISNRMDNRVYANTPYFGGPPDQNQLTDVITRDPVYLSEFITDWAIVNDKTQSPFGAGWSLSDHENLVIDPQTRFITLIKGNERFTYYTPINPGTGQYVTQKLVSEGARNLTYKNGYIYGADCEKNEIFKVDSLGRYTTVAGGSTDKYLSLNCPSSVFVSRKGGLYIADTGNGRIVYLEEDGTFKTLASSKDKNIQKPTFVTEDNILAVHFIDGSEIKTISPHDGSIVTMIADDPKAHFNYKLENPSQIHYDRDFNLLVLDQGLGKIIKFYMNSGVSREILKGLKVRELASDDMRKNFYLLTEDGKVHFWNGLGHKETFELEALGNTLSVKGHQKKARATNYKSIAFSPVSGLVMIGNSGLSIRSIDEKYLKNKNTYPVQFYVPFKGDTSAFWREDNGDYLRLLPNNDIYTYDSSGRFKHIYNISTGDFEGHSYDENQRLIQIDFGNRGGLYKFNYTDGKLSEIIDPAGRKILLSINESNDLISITDPEGYSQQFDYDKHVLVRRTDESSQSTTYTYNMGRITKAVKPGNRTMNIFDAILNQVLGSIQNTNASGLESQKVTTLVSSPEGRSMGYVLSSAGAPEAMIDGYGNYTLYTRDFQNLPNEEISPEGRVTYSTFNREGHMIARTDDNGKTNYVWNQNNKLLSMTDAFNNQTNFTYDPNGNLLEVTSPTGKKTKYSYYFGGLLRDTTDTAGNITSFDVDFRQNITAITDPLGARTEFTRAEDGNILSILNPLRRMTTFQYDDLGRMISTTDARFGVTALTYTPTGEIESVTDAKNNRTLFGYNEFKKVTSITNPASQTVSYNYDGDENLTSKHTKASQLVSYTYDANNRLTLKSSPDDQVGFDYDLDGKLVKATDNDSEVTFEYDKFGRLFRETSDHYDGSVEHEYDERGSKSSTKVFVAGRTLVSVSRKFDSFKTHLEKTFWAEGKNGTVWSFRDSADRPGHTKLPNNIDRFVAYDKANRIQALYINASALNFSSNYIYNPVGSIVGINELYNGQLMAHRYSYDELQQLAGEESTVKTWNYDRDLVGNDVSVNMIHNNLNQILQSTDYLYEYDLNGNRTKKTSRYTSERVEYTWSSENLLKSAKIFKNSVLVKTVSYQYDPTGRRIIRNVNDHLNSAKSYGRKYVYDGQQVIAILDEDNNFVSAYIHGDEIDDPQVMITDYDKDGEADVLSFIKDHLGSVKFITDENQNILEEIHYSAFGETQVKRVGPHQVKVGNNFYYTGRELEPETGDYYYRARYYDPYSTKFLSEDPIGFSSNDTNFYRYVNNRPLTRNDPFGLLENPWSVFDRAVSMTEKWFPNSSGTNDSADAFRHCYASCEMVKENGYTAALLSGNAHEFAGSLDGQPQCEANMDIRNNAIGRLYGLGKDDCQKRCFDAAATGLLTTLP